MWYVNLLHYTFICWETKSAYLSEEQKRLYLLSFPIFSASRVAE